MKETILNIKSDLYRYYGKINYKTFVKSILLVEGFRYMFFSRLKSGLPKWNPLYWLAAFSVRILSYWYGFQIDSKKIGKGLYIGHFGTVIVSVNAEIGNNVNLSPGVVIGMVSRGSRKGAPKIGDNVWIGSNAIIVGKIKIGDNSLIAPGAYITFDVPENSLVKGNPGVINEGIGVEGYILHKWNVAP